MEIRSADRETLEVSFRPEDLSIPPAAGLIPEFWTSRWVIG
jgi:hypothetical protein